MYELIGKEIDEGMLLVKVLDRKSGIVFSYYEDEIPNIKNSNMKKFFQDSL